MPIPSLHFLPPKNTNLRFLSENARSIPTPSLEIEDFVSALVFVVLQVDIKGKQKKQLLLHMFKQETVRYLHSNY